MRQWFLESTLRRVSRVVARVGATDATLFDNQDQRELVFLDRSWCHHHRRFLSSRRGCHFGLRRAISRTADLSLSLSLSLFAQRARGPISVKLSGSISEECDCQFPNGDAASLAAAARASCRASEPASRTAPRSYFRARTSCQSRRILPTCPFVGAAARPPQKTPHTEEILPWPHLVSLRQSNLF